MSQNPEDPEDLADTAPTPEPAGAAPVEERVQPLSVDEGRRPALGPVEGVPPYLERRLRRWLSDFLNHGRKHSSDDLSGLEYRIALRLGVDLPGREQRVYNQPGVEMLDVVHLALRLDRELEHQLETVRMGWFDGDPPTDRAVAVVQLAEMLEDANSVYRVGYVDDCLERRLRPHSQSGFVVLILRRGASAPSGLARP